MRPPVIPLPKQTAYVKHEKYISGIQFNKRKLNSVEISLLYHGIENNSFGMQMISGFAQVAENEEVKKYFIKGKELSKQILMVFNELMIKSDLKIPGESFGVPLDSSQPPFSDKLMMYLINLFSNFSLTSNALGTSFTLRPDLPLKMLNMANDIFSFAKEGAKIMIENGWMEQPPQ
ncbi:DUF3231 family protein [Metabacillus arenae]|uniref:DUF3231 family protein n=1 Tax=Metabacillus arenae TaxID=2771434 RepID=UPI002964C165|nr:DUF3231 family protein [Metabacillus arenae]